MKKSFVIFFIALLSNSLLLSNSCSKKDDSVALALPSSMTASIDNDSWTSVFRDAVLYDLSNAISIIATPEISVDGNKRIWIDVYGKKEGTYELNEALNKHECLVLYRKTTSATFGSDDFYVSNTAIITITKLDRERQLISGTFSATLLQSSQSGGANINITNGKFENLNYVLGIAGN